MKHSLDPHGDDAAQIPDVAWLKAADNPWTEKNAQWGVPVLDVRPVTLTMLSMSGDPKCASNAVSFRQDDGWGFIGEEPREGRSIQASLRFPIDRLLADGVLFAPRQMEHKWAIFYHRRQIIFVRSWLRQVQAVARVEEHKNHIEITEIRGTFVAKDEKPALTIRVVDYLLRSHALDVVYPAPLPPGLEKDTKAAAMWRRHVGACHTLGIAR